jgi:hypothetical protein
MVSLPAGLTSIGAFAFYDCSRLEQIEIPASVTKIAEGAFGGCGTLRQMIVRNPACKVYIGEDSDEDLLADPYTLGLFRGENIYGRHDAAKASTEPWRESSEYYAYVEYTAKRFNYKFNFYRTDAFADVSEGVYFEIPVAWAYGRGVTDGTDDTHFSPNATCTRGQVVTFLWRAVGCPEPVSKNNPFVDVSSSAYYYSPVRWALENGITDGTDSTHFSPDRTCSRGQIVTFLYRLFNLPGQLRVVRQPVTVWRTYGGETKATYSVEVAGGIAPYTYQWYRRYGALGYKEISGQTGPTMTYNTSASTSVYCKITDARGNSVSSRSAGDWYRLYISKQPEGGARTGGGLTLSVTCSGGSLPFTYQWYRNGKSISGATDSTYYATASGFYVCVITDDNGDSVTTNSAHVT